MYTTPREGCHTVQLREVLRAWITLYKLMATIVANVTF